MSKKEKGLGQEHSESPKQECENCEEKERLRARARVRHRGCGEGDREK